MYDELKEKIQQNKKIELNDIFASDDGADWEGVEVLLDYITNLQGELKATQELVVNYKSRCEKAIAHINDRILKGFEKFGYDPDIVAPIIVNDLLNILNGEDNDLNKKELIDILKG